MPKKISLATYTIRVKKARERSGDFLRLSDFGEELHADTYNFLTSFLQSLKNAPSRDERKSKLLKPTTIDVLPEDRIVKGIIETGDYGYESELIDSNDWTLNYKRRVNDAEMLPFYFLLNVPEVGDEGIAIFQRFGNLGITTVFKDAVQAAFRMQYEEYTIHINPLVPEQLVEQYLRNGNVTKIVLKKFKIPDDIADFFDNPDHREIEAHAELRIVSKRNRFLPIRNRLNNFLSNEVNKLIELDSFEYDQASLEIKLNENTRTINLDGESKMRAYFDVTNDVELMQNGHPNYNSIDVVAHSLLREVHEAIYPRND